MSSVVIPTPVELSLATVMAASPRLHDLLLDGRLDELRAIARYLLSGLESLERPAVPEPAGELNLDDEVKRYEMTLIRAALAKAGGNQTRAARILGVKLTTLNTKIKRYQMM